MQHIVSITGSGVGPSGSKVEPRACKHCGYYGHTRQHCQKRARAEEEALEAYARKCRKEDAMVTKVDRVMQPYQRASQEAWFDEFGWVWERDPARWWMGPEVLLDRDGGHGKWVRVQGTVKMADE